MYGRRIFRRKPRDEGLSVAQFLRHTYELRTPQFTLHSSLLFGMLVLMEVGRRIGLRRMAEDSEGAHAQDIPVNHSEFSSRRGYSTSVRVECYRRGGSG